MYWCHIHRHGYDHDDGDDDKGNSHRDIPHDHGDDDVHAHAHARARDVYGVNDDCCPLFVVRCPLYDESIQQLQRFYNIRICVYW